MNTENFIPAVIAAAFLTFGMVAVMASIGASARRLWAARRAEVSAGRADSFQPDYDPDSPPPGLSEADHRRYRKLAKERRRLVSGLAGLRYEHDSRADRGDVLDPYICWYTRRVIDRRATLKRQLEDELDELVGTN